MASDYSPNVQCFQPMKNFWQDYRSYCIVTIDPVAQRLVNPCLPARKWSITSCDNLIVVDTLGFSLNGRPRRTAVLENFSGQPSLDRSGAVSGSKSCAIELSFPFIGFPQCNVQITTFHFINDIATIHQLGKRHDHHNFRTPLAILLASILYSHLPEKSIFPRTVLTHYASLKLDSLNLYYV